MACDVVAPSLIPKGGSDKVPYGPAGRVPQARLLRAGELTAVRVPTRAEEAVRDLVRVRAALLADRKRAQQRLTAALMRHGCIWTQGVVLELRGAPGVDRRAAVRGAGAGGGDRALPWRAGHPGDRVAAIEAALAPWALREPLAGPVARLGCYRGIAELNGLTLVSEIIDWRRFACARAFMSYTWVVPAEYSSGGGPPRAHHQGRL